jgi:hypothetical protein
MAAQASGKKGALDMVSRRLSLILALIMPLSMAGLPAWAEAETTPAAATQAGAQAGAHQGHGDHEATPGHEKKHHSVLEDAMETLGHSMKKLAPQLKDKTKNESSLKLLSTMEAAIIRAKDTIPPMTDEQPVAERPAYVVKFRQQLITLLDHMLKTENALLAGDNDAAQAQLPQIKKIMDDGHHEFRPPMH